MGVQARPGWSLDPWYRLLKILSLYLFIPGDKDKIEMTSSVLSLILSYLIFYLGDTMLRPLKTRTPLPIRRWRLAC